MLWSREPSHFLSVCGHHPCFDRHVFLSHIQQSRMIQSIGMANYWIAVGWDNELRIRLGGVLRHFLKPGSWYSASISSALTPYFYFFQIVTPLRYMTTLGVTYYAIKYLSRLGYIKPMPSRKQIKAMIAHKRDQFRQNRHRIQQEKLKKRHPPTSPSNGHHHHPHPHSHNHPKKPHE